MAWYAYCIAERQAFPELCRHRRPMPLAGVSGLFGNQTFLFPASDLAIIVSEHSPEDSARMDQQAAKDHARVISGCLMVQVFDWIVLGNDDGKVTGWIEEDLISGDPGKGLKGDRFTVAGEFRECLLLADAVGVPRHRGYRSIALASSSPGDLPKRAMHKNRGSTPWRAFRRAAPNLRHILALAIHNWQLQSHLPLAGLAALPQWASR